jgi:hypothetical protein
MKDTDTWKTDGVVIGSPAYRMSVSDTPDIHSVLIDRHQDGWVLINQISLSPEQAEELLKFLVSEEHTLILIAVDEERDIREACVMVVDLLIKRAKKKRLSTRKRVVEMKKLI